VPRQVALKVFISHASTDGWVAGQIAKELRATGAECFLDSHAIDTGDEIDDELLTGLNEADELLVLMTPTALERPYVWIELGIAWSQGKRIIGILYGMTTTELAERDGTPAFLKGVLLRDINDFEKYLDELKGRLDHG
jgi:TIR domain